MTCFWKLFVALIVEIPCLSDPPGAFLYAFPSSGQGPIPKATGVYTWTLPAAPLSPSTFIDPRGDVGIL